MTKDFGELLLGGIKDRDAIERITKNRLAEMYREAYAQAKADVGNLYNALENDITLANAHRYKRLDSLLSNLGREYKKLTGKAIHDTEWTIGQMYAESWHRYAWSANQATGINLSWGVLPVDAIRASVFSEFSGLTFIKTMQKNGANELSQIQAAITRSLATGSSFTKVADELKGLFNKGYSDAMRVVRTEGLRAYSEGFLAQHEKAKSLGINVRKKWSTRLDGRERESHAALDGTYADDDGLFWIDGVSAEAPRLFGVASEDINCRCTAYDDLVGISEELERLRAKDGAEPYQPYLDYKEARGWTEGDGWQRANDALEIY